VSAASRVPLATKPPSANAWKNAVLILGRLATNVALTQW
jgi:hypothetical protein